MAFPFFGGGRGPEAGAPVPPPAPNNNENGPIDGNLIALLAEIDALRGQLGQQSELAQTNIDGLRDNQIEQRLNEVYHQAACRVMETARGGRELPPEHRLVLIEDLTRNAQESELARLFLSRFGFRTFNDALSRMDIRDEAVRAGNLVAQLDEHYHGENRVANNLRQTLLGGGISTAVLGTIAVFGGPITWAAGAGAVVGSMAGGFIGRWIAERRRTGALRRREQNGETEGNPLNERAAQDLLGNIDYMVNQGRETLNEAGNDQNRRAEALRNIFDVVARGESESIRQYQTLERRSNCTRMWYGTAGSVIGGMAGGLIGSLIHRGAEIAQVQELVKNGKMPIDTDGDGIFHFVHTAYDHGSYFQMIQGDVNNVLAHHGKDYLAHFSHYVGMQGLQGPINSVPSVLAQGGTYLHAGVLQGLNEAIAKQIIEKSLLVVPTLIGAVAGGAGGLGPELINVVRNPNREPRETRRRNSYLLNYFARPATSEINEQDDHRLIWIVNPNARGEVNVGTVISYNNTQYIVRYLDRDNDGNITRIGAVPADVVGIPVQQEGEAQPDQTEPDQTEPEQTPDQTPEVTPLTPEEQEDLTHGFGDVEQLINDARTIATDRDRLDRFNEIVLPDDYQFRTPDVREIMQGMQGRTLMLVVPSDRRTPERRDVLYILNENRINEGRVTRVPRDDSQRIEEIDINADWLREFRNHLGNTLRGAGLLNFGPSSNVEEPPPGGEPTPTPEPTPQTPPPPTRDNVEPDIEPIAPNPERYNRPELIPTLNELKTFLGNPNNRNVTLPINEAMGSFPGNRRYSVGPYEYNGHEVTVFLPGSSRMVAEEIFRDATAENREPTAKVEIVNPMIVERGSYAFIEVYGKITRENNEEEVPPTSPPPPEEPPAEQKVEEPTITVPPVEEAKEEPQEPTQPFNLDSIAEPAEFPTKERIKREKKTKKGKPEMEDADVEVVPQPKKTKKRKEVKENTSKEIGEPTVGLRLKVKDSLFQGNHEKEKQAIIDAFDLDSNSLNNTEFEIIAPPENIEEDMVMIQPIGHPEASMDISLELIRDSFELA